MADIRTKSYFLKRNQYLYVFTIALLAQGCEFESNDDNFHQVQQPPAEVELGIDLAGVNPYDTIYAYNYTCFQYSIDAGAREVVAQQFFVDGKEVNTNPVNGSACIEATNADNQVHDLSVSMLIRSGTGSLADYAGLENYLGEFSFKVKVLDDEFEEMHLRSSVNESKQLKLSWDKPRGYGDISGYEIHSHNQLLATINDPNTTSWVDEDYAYGYKDYQVKAEVTNSWGVTINEATTASYTTMLPGDIRFERTSVNQMRVKWTNPNPYPCKYVLRFSSGTTPVYAEEGTTEAIIPVGNFPVGLYPFSLYIIPSGAAYEDFEHYSSVSTTFSDARLSYGITLEPDIYRNRFLTLNFDRLAIYDASGMRFSGATVHQLDLSTGSEIKVDKEGRIAISEGLGKIHIFKNSALTEELFTASLFPLHSFCFSENDLLLANTGNGFRLYEVNTGNLLLSKEWEQGVDPYATGYLTAAISRDGRYLAVIGRQFTPEQQWVDLYELKSDFTLNLLHHFPDIKASQLAFYPLDPQLLIIQYQNGTFAIIDMNGQIRKTVEGKFLNADPFTGNILYKQADYSSPYQVKILAPDFNEILSQLEIPNLGNDEIRLYHNLIFYFMYYAPVDYLVQQN